MKRLLFFGIILVVLGYWAVQSGVVKNNPLAGKKFTINPNILGSTIHLNTPQSSSFSPFLQNSLDSAKGIATQKFVEIEKSVAQTLEKQVADLTKSQINAIQTQICRDWGVISPIPSPSSQP